MAKKKVYQCPECGLHYNDETIMKKCASWCSRYKSCNLDITKSSVELQEAKDADNA